MLKFCIKVFNIFSFLKPCMDLLYIWHDYRYWSRIGPELHSTLSPPCDLEVKVTDLEMLSLSFT